LREWRQTYAERIARYATAGGAPRVDVPLDIPTVVARLARRRYATSEAEYGEIEDGARLPRNPTGFLEAVFRALEVDPAEQTELIRRLVHEVVREELGEELTEVVFGPPAPIVRYDDEPGEQAGD
jgi:hypothetical protein